MENGRDLLISGSKDYVKSVKKNSINAASKKYVKRFKPRITDYFSKETIIQLYENALDIMQPDNNVKADNIVKILGPSFSEVGTGTNRITFAKGGYAIKIALDRRGLIDNWYEYKRSTEVPNLVAKCYETNRVVAISEYVNVLSREEYKQNKPALARVLTLLTSRYIVKDLGLTPKNYCNWGYRNNGNIVALDYAYMYPIADNPMALKCSCGGDIRLDDTFTIYRCNNADCGLTYNDMEILNKMEKDFETFDDVSIIESTGANINSSADAEYLNVVKMKSFDDNSANSAYMVNIDDHGDDSPVNSSDLAEFIKSHRYNYMMESDDSSDAELSKFQPNAEPITKEEFFDASNAFEDKKE